MSLKILIKDGEGSNITAGVTADKALKVTNIPISIKEVIESEGNDLLGRQKVFFSLFSDTSGNDDLNIDGYTSATDFAIYAEEDRLKAIYSIRFIIEDQSLSFGSSEGRRFGSAASSPGLCNGLELFVIQSGYKNNLLAENIRNISDFMKYGDEIINQPDAIAMGTDLLMAEIKFCVPIYLVPEKLDKLVVRVQDDLSSMSYFKVIARGIQEIAK